MEIKKELRVLFELALPMAVLQFSVHFVFPETASAVGLHLGKEYLAGFSLGSLTGNLTLLTITVGVASAADTLMPRAFANGQYEELGKLAIRTFVVAMIVMLLPCILLVTYAEPIYEAFHQNLMVSHIAAQWLRVFVLGSPFTLLVRVCQRFLGSQHVVWPLGISTSISAFIFHPIMLWIFVPTMGFVGSAVAVAITQFMQIFLALVYLKYFPVHHPRSWEGLTWEKFKEACQLRPMLAYARLSIGGVLSFTEWCFWETTCLIVGSLGVIPLDIHSVANNIIPVAGMIPLGLSIALSMRMGHIMSEDTKKAQVLAGVSMVITVIFSVLLALLFYSTRDFIVTRFTRNSEVMEGCKEIWANVCIVLVLRFIYVINTGILRGLGMQWRMAAIVLVVLWFSCIPTLIHVGIFAGGGVVAIWNYLSLFYVALNVLLILCYVVADWEKINNSIKEKKARSEAPVPEEQPTERTRLV